MSRYPSSRRTRLTRRGRLVRTSALGVLAIVLLALIVGKLGGGGEKELPTPTVAFKVGSVKMSADAARPPAATVTSDQQRVTAVLNDWFQQGFVDPKKFGDGTFPMVAAHFAKEARDRFKLDIPTLTIGDAREDVKRVVPQVARASIGLFYGDGKPSYAVARVTFIATATLKEKDSLPLRIVFTGDVTLERQGNDWLITYYKANQSQNSVQATPSASATS